MPRIIIVVAIVVVVAAAAVSNDDDLIDVVIIIWANECTNELHSELIHKHVCTSKLSKLIFWGK